MRRRQWGRYFLLSMGLTLAAPLWARKVSIPVYDIDRGVQYDADLGVVPYLPNPFEDSPLRLIPSGALAVASQLNRFVARELLEREGVRRAVLTSGPFEAWEITLTPKELELVQGGEKAFGLKWLIPPPQDSYQKGDWPLLAGTLLQTRIRRQTRGDRVRAQCEALFDTGEKPYWIPCSAVHGIWNEEMLFDFHATPLFFLRDPETNRAEAPVELIDFTATQAIVVSHAQLQTFPNHGLDIEFFAVDKDRLIALSPGLWWTRAVRGIDGQLLTSHKPRRRSSPTEALQELRQWYHRRYVTPRTPEQACFKALLSLKNRVFDGLHSTIRYSKFVFWGKD